MNTRQRQKIGNEQYLALVVSKILAYNPPLENYTEIFLKKSVSIGP